MAPDASATDTVPEVAPKSEGVRPNAAPNPTIQEFTAELARIAGIQASKRQAFPGIKKLRAAWVFLAQPMRHYRAMPANGIINESKAGN